MTCCTRQKTEKKHPAPRCEGGDGEQPKLLLAGRGKSGRSCYSLDEDGAKKGQKHARTSRGGAVACFSLSFLLIEILGL